MTLKLYNTMSRHKEPLKPIREGQVGMYVCGITVYDHLHVGHVRSMMAFDVLSRYLKFCGYKVTHVRNITDIDDKIIARAQEVNEPWQQLTERYIGAMHELMHELDLDMPDHEPRATDYIDEMVAMIETLIEKGYAYAAHNGDVFYAVRKFSAYGKLSGKKIEDLQVGARIQRDEAKRDPLDFVLWKAAKPGEPSWASPWGLGRPGWHIECSVMSFKLLGETFDIHGGGLDLEFPHHENEIAQSCAVHDAELANIWMHNGFVQLDNEKMSKSLGNFFVAKEVLERFEAEELRMLMLLSHYRKPINYSDHELSQARECLSRLYNSLLDVDFSADLEVLADYEQRFLTAMDDDLNTPQAMAVLFELSKEIYKAKEIGDSERQQTLAISLKKLGSILGLLQQSPQQFLKSPKRSAVSDTEKMISNEAIELLITEREQARANKDWAASDRIRDQLKEAGIILEDKAGKTIWRR